MTPEQLWASFVEVAKQNGYNMLPEVHFQDSVLAAILPHEKQHFSAIAQIYFKPMVRFEALDPGVVPPTVSDVSESVSGEEAVVEALKKE